MMAPRIRGGSGFNADLCAKGPGAPPPPREQRRQFRGCGGSSVAAWRAGARGTALRNQLWRSLCREVACPCVPRDTRVPHRDRGLGRAVGEINATAGGGQRVRTGGAGSRDPSKGQKAESCDRFPRAILVPKVAAKL